MLSQRSDTCLQKVVIRMLNKNTWGVKQLGDQSEVALQTSQVRPKNSDIS